MSDEFTTGRAMAFERLLSEDAIMLPQYQKLSGRGIFLAKALNRPFEFERTDTAYSKTLDFLPANWKGAAIESIGGKTVVWNQLQAPSTAPSDRSRNGVTYSITNDGKSIVANGTASSLSYQNFGYKNGERVQIVQGHKYLLTGCPSGGGSTTYRLDLNAVGIGYDEGNGRIGTASSTPSTMPYIYAQVASGYTATNLTFTPQLFDLTLMFGAGNEPATVAEFQAIFPTINPAYDAGSLKSAGVTGAVSVGRNLFDFNAYKTALSALPAQAVRGTVSFGDGTVTLVATGNDAYTDFSSNTYKVYTKPSTTYTFTVTYNGTENGSFFVFQYRKDGTSITNSSVAFTGNGTQSKTISFGANTAYVKMRFGVQKSGNSATFSNIQVEEGSTATAYTLYMTQTLPIPAAVQSLPGYGWSAGSVCNEVDWERKVYIQRVGSVDLGTLAWSIQASTGQERFFTSGIANEIASVQSADTKGNILCPLYVTATFNDLVGHVQDKVISEGTNKFIQIYDSSKMSMTWTEFKASLSGVMLYYELATPIETDISAYLSDDNLIEVEPGGTLTFENQLGDGYRIPVPTKVKYQRRISNS